MASPTNAQPPLNKIHFPEIPHSFIYNCKFLSWADILWAYEKNLVNLGFLIGYADHHVSSGLYDPLEFEIILQSALDTEIIENLSKSLAKKEGDKKLSKSKEKWIFIALKWIFENKTTYTDPLGEVESIYEDFDYPLEIESFVRYMPPANDYNPKKHNTTENIKKLFQNWSDYLERKSSALENLDNQQKNQNI